MAPNRDRFKVGPDADTPLRRASTWREGAAFPGLQ
jgi:hypothetical protein